MRFPALPSSARLLLMLAIAALAAPIHAQDAGKSSTVEIRSVLQDPVHPGAELFIPTAAGAMAKLILVPGEMAPPQKAQVTDGKLSLYATADPKAAVAGVVTMPAGMNRAIMVIVRMPDQSQIPYKMVVIDDSANVFPKGESRVVSLVGADVAVEAGEHKIPAKAGTVTRVPPVKKVNEFNMAQTNFYYKQRDSWVPFTERQLQFSDEMRRLFIVHVTPGALSPSVTTIIDSVPQVPAKAGG